MKTTQEKTEIQKLAEKYLAQFVPSMRKDGKKFWIMKSEKPEVLRVIVQKAHNGMLPDDYKYQFVVDSLQALVDYDDPDDIRDEMKADPYNHDLLAWVSSNLTRAEYVNEGVKEFGGDVSFDLFKALGWGQYLEKVEVFEIVRAYVEQEAS